MDAGVTPSNSWAWSVHKMQNRMLKSPVNERAKQGLGTAIRVIEVLCCFFF